MNPYDFVRIDWTRLPERRRPIWHHRLTAQDAQHLYSGYLDVDLYAETPLFIANSRGDSSDPKNLLSLCRTITTNILFRAALLKACYVVW